MTTTVKVTGVNVEDAKECLIAALEYLNASGNIRDFSLTVKPFKRSLNSDDNEPIQKTYSFGLQTNGRVV